MSAVTLNCFGKWASLTQAWEALPAWEKSHPHDKPFTVAWHPEGGAYTFVSAPTDTEDYWERHPKTKEESAQSERFVIEKSADYVKRSPMRWIIPGVLPQAELAVIYGPSGSGKSFLAYDMAATITEGSSWCSWQARQGNVLVIAAEGAAGMRSRVQARADANFSNHAKLPDIIADAPNLLDEKQTALLIHRIVASGTRYAVIVIDTVSATTPGANENSSDDMGKLLSHCKLLHRKTGALILAVDHAGKAVKKGMRGWSGKYAAADTVLEVTGGSARGVTIRKQKDGEEGQSWRFNLKQVQLGHNEDGDRITSCVVTYPVNTLAAADDKPEPRGKYEPEIMKVVRAEMPITEIIRLVKEATVYDGERDRRDQWILKSVDKLLEKKLLRKVAGTNSVAPFNLPITKEFDS